MFYHMVERVQSGLDATYAALADPTRRAILDRLRHRGPARVTELARQFPVSLTAVSKHIRVLEGAGLVRREVRGREHVLSLDAAPLAEAGSWIAGYQAFWQARADALAKHVEDRTLQPSTAGPAR
jgi:DNA-binding transcriptional ArsR family regulator